MTKALIAPLVVSPLWLVHPAIAQGFPEACDGIGLRVRSETYTMTALLSMQAHICAEIAPDTAPSFDRVLARYRENGNRGQRWLSRKSTLTPVSTVAFPLDKEPERFATLNATGISF